LPATSNHNNNHRPSCLVTGANAGIGFEIARGLARGGFRVALACRDRAKGEAARKTIASEISHFEVELLIVDLASPSAIRAAAREFSANHDSLDVLVNNAGTSSHKRRETPEGFELTFATNVLGYYLLTGELLDLLRRAPAARVINTASMMAYGLDLDDVNFKRRRYDASTAYAQSKQADRMLTWALARRLAGTPVTANAFHPGAVNTALLRSLAPGFSGITPAEGADTAIWLATSRELAGVSGRLWVRRRETPCEFRGRDNEEALWSLCEQMTRV
jgi:NAD(P)-dependent dehydrogenase (short-subunit alcohol dehydrogenase family)